MPDNATVTQAKRLPPPTTHQLALMIWVAVFPTLTVLSLTLRNSLSGLPVVMRTFMLAIIAVLVVIYGLLPQLHRVRVDPLTHRATP